MQKRTAAELLDRAKELREMAATRGGDEPLLAALLLVADEFEREAERDRYRSLRLVANLLDLPQRPPGGV
jgi:hypothetical protein